MTGFCGALARNNDSHAVGAQQGRLEVAKKVLSRNPEDVTQTFAEGPVFVVAFDNGAIHSDRLFVDDGTTLAWVSGDPLIVADDGVTNDPHESVTKTTYAISHVDKHILARTTGIFSAISWNRATGNLRLVADKLALRPVYVYLDATVCLFATNLRTLRELAGRPLSIDEQGFAELMYFGQCLGPRTIYRNVRILRPGEILTVGPTQEQSEFYFDWTAIPRKSGSETDLCGQLYDGFIRSIRRRSRHSTADAFLSGGMDSRCVVAGLLDIGCKARTFGMSYPGSADDVIGRIVANAFGLEHITHACDPSERLLTNLVPRALIARDHFPPQSGSAKGARVIWGGDGGSVGMGHVYLDRRSIGLAAGTLSDDSIYQLFPRLNRLKTHLLRRKKAEHLRGLAVAGIRSELEAVRSAPPDRRLFYFYLRNDQSRHLYEHFENIDLSGIELLEPFFDSDFLALVAAHPVESFLNHHLYNCWINQFRTPAGALPWQAYPGHEPCPHPMPKECVSQWTKGWYAGSRARRVSDRICAQILNTKDGRVQKYISYRAVRLLRLLNRIGIERYNWEVWLARRLFDAITGEQVQMQGMK